MNLVKQLAAANKLVTNMATGENEGPTILVLLNEDGKIYVFDDGQWVHASSEPGNAVAVTIGPVGLWCLDKDGFVYLWNNNPTESLWTKDSGIKDVNTLTCDSKGNLWCTQKNGEISMKPTVFVGLGSASGKMFEMGSWAKVTMTSAPFSGELGTWEYNVRSGEKLNKIVKTEYQVNGDKNIERISKEIVRLNKLKNAEVTFKDGQKLIMPPLNYR